MEKGECLGERGTDEPDVLDGGRRGPEEQGACQGVGNILNTIPDVETHLLDTDDELRGVYK